MNIPRPPPREPGGSDEPTPADDPFAGPRWDEGKSRRSPGPAADGTRRKRIRVSRRKRRRRRRIGLLMVTVGALIVLGGLWIIVTGLFARSELTKARAEVHQLRDQISAGDLTAARATAADLARHAHRAHELTTGPVWAMAAGLPAGGEPLHTIRGITAGIDAIGQNSLPQLVTASQSLDPASVRRPDGSIDLAKVSTVTPALDHASTIMSATTHTIDALPQHTWLSSIDSARNDVAAQLAALGRTVRSADVASRVLPALLGANGPKRYFVAFQNDAEARGTGGLSGAFAILQADHGTLKFERFESDTALAGISADVNLGKDYDQLYGASATTTLTGNANLSPHFPYAAQIWASMWKKKTGERVDGVMALDPSALSDLLAVTGPTRTADGTAVSAANIVSLSQSVVYAKYATDNEGRRAFLLAIARAVSNKILETHGSTTALVRAAGQAAGERRLLMWAADPAIEAELQQTSVSGIIPVTTAPYVGLSIVNDGGNKLDYYLDRSITWQRSGCGTIRQTTTTIVLTNNAPASGLSPYVTGRSDSHSYPVKPGDNRLEVSYFATSGATMSSVDVNGTPGTATIGMEQGHPVYTVDLELPRGTSRTITLHLTEPAGTGSPIVLRQPLVRPLHVSVQDSSCR